MGIWKEFVGQIQKSLNASFFKSLNDMFFVGICKAMGILTSLFFESEKISSNTRAINHMSRVMLNDSTYRTTFVHC